MQRDVVKIFAGQWIASLCPLINLNMEITPVHLNFCPWRVPLCPWLYLQSLTEGRDHTSQRGISSLRKQTEKPSAQIISGPVWEKSSHPEKKNQTSRCCVKYLAFFWHCWRLLNIITLWKLRVTQWFGLKGPSNIVKFQPPVMVRDNFH